MLTLREETAQRFLPLPAWDWKGCPGSLSESEEPTLDFLPCLNLSYHLKSLGQPPTFTPRATSSPHPAYPSTQACYVAHSQGPEHSATPLPGLRVTRPPLHRALPDSQTEWEAKAAPPASCLHHQLRASQGGPRVSVWEDTSVRPDSLHSDGPRLVAGPWLTSGGASLYLQNGVEGGPVGWGGKTWGLRSQGSSQLNLCGCLAEHLCLSFSFLIRKMAQHMSYYKESPRSCKMPGTGGDAG